MCPLISLVKGPSLPGLAISSLGGYLVFAETGKSKASKPAVIPRKWLNVVPEIPHGSVSFNGRKLGDRPVLLRGR
jgi:hypothetical protein